MKLKSFCTLKETITRINRQLPESIFAYLLDKGLISIIYNDTRRLNSKNHWANELNRHFLEEIQMASKHMKKCSAIFSHKGNANQSYIEIPPYLSQNHYHQEKKQ
jgi:hypothetical protein